LPQVRAHQFLSLLGLNTLFPQEENNVTLSKQQVAALMAAEFFLCFSSYKPAKVQFEM